MIMEGSGGGRGAAFLGSTFRAREMWAKPLSLVLGQQGSGASLRVREGKGIEKSR